MHSNDVKYVETDRISKWEFLGSDRPQSLRTVEILAETRGCNRVLRHIFDPASALGRSTNTKWPTQFSGNFVGEARGPVISPGS